MGIQSPGVPPRHPRQCLGQNAEAIRRDDKSVPPLEQGLDLSHTAMEANRVMAGHWRRAEAAWEKAEAADNEVARSAPAR